MSKGADLTLAVFLYGTIFFAIFFVCYSFLKLFFLSIIGIMRGKRKGGSLIFLVVVQIVLILVLYLGGALPIILGMLITPLVFLTMIFIEIITMYGKETLTFLSVIFIPIIIMYGKEKNGPLILLGLIGAYASITFFAMSVDDVPYFFILLAILYFLAFLTRMLATEHYIVVLQSLAGIAVGSFLIVFGIQLNSEFQKPTEIRQLQRAIGKRLTEGAIGQKLTEGMYQLNAYGQVVKLSLVPACLTCLNEDEENEDEELEKRLFDNQLTQLPPEIGQLTQLQELDLRNNKLTQLPPEIGQLTQLRELHLNGNQITQLPKEIGQLTQLHIFR